MSRFPILLLLLVLPGVASAQRNNDSYLALRRLMVDRYIETAGVSDRRVLDAMRRTPRHEFVPANLRDKAYYDMALPIGDQQTISSPFIVAYMTESLATQPSDKVLEIGTGSGYQAAVLSPLVKEVYTIEIVKELGDRAARTLKRLRYNNVHVKVGDGFQGWPEHAPFDKIIVTCSPEEPPQPLIDQLAEGGLIVIPVGERYQQTLFLMRKKDGKLESEPLRPTLFVPMTGVAEQNRDKLPDPKNPRILNGDFEEVTPANGFVPGWYYQRQGKWTKDAASPSGEYCLTFRNADAGRTAHILQGFAIDGQTVKELKVSLSARSPGLRDGLFGEEFAAVVVSFYDANRRDLGYRIVERFRGEFPWTRVEGQVRVPPDAAEAILRLGLFGATGEISFDNVALEAVK